MPSQEADRVEELLDELQELADTLGLDTATRVIARVRKPQSRFLVGEGKAQEIVEQARASRSNVIVFDEDLTPSQQRNWEALAQCAVIDRQEVILAIFASRAHTREAVLQVELAQATYNLPRLKRRWGHLSRQRGMRGGMGLRGEGEQQIEVDSRLVRRRIVQLRKELGEIRRQRAVQRRRRMKKPIPVAAIVGYTNAGKSSLLNALTDAGVLTEDKLFATLDPTVRRLLLPNRQEILLTDTVGFIRKLPHLLIDAFRATLEESLHADFLLEVVDVTSPVVEEHHDTTVHVLSEIGCERTPSILVFNKLDLARDPIGVQRLKRRHRDALFVSARTGAGLPELRDRLAKQLESGLREAELLIPHGRYDVIALLHRTSHIRGEEHEDGGVRLDVAVPLWVWGAVRKFASPPV